MKKFEVRYFYSLDGYVSGDKFWSAGLVKSKAEAKRKFITHMKQKEMRHFHVASIKEAA